MNDFLEHHGILGQRWGVRRFQYRDGSLTPEGQKRYNLFRSTMSRLKEFMPSRNPVRDILSRELMRSALRFSGVGKVPAYLIVSGASEVQKVLNKHLR